PLTFIDPHGTGSDDWENDPEIARYIKNEQGRAQAFRSELNLNAKLTKAIEEARLTKFTAEERLSAYEKELSPEAPRSSRLSKLQEKVALAAKEEANVVEKLEKSSARLEALRRITHSDDVSAAEGELPHSEKIADFEAKLKQPPPKGGGGKLGGGGG